MKVHFSSKTDDWATPQEFFNKLDEKYKFTLDVCASRENHKCFYYYTILDDGLSKNWKGHTCWMNPPYGREIKHWVKKAALSETPVVALLPARTDTAWWHDWVLPYAKITFIRGRLKFGGAKNSAPFPSAIAEYYCDDL